MDTKILQFGEGRFLKAFIDWMVQRLNDTAGFDGAVEIIQPRGAEFKPASLALNATGGRYVQRFRGVENGETVDREETITAVKCVHLASEIERLALIPSVRFVFSNTTEAGIEYVPGADTFPSKLCRLLKARHDAGLPGLVILPCELIEDNGVRLRDCVLRHAPEFEKGDLKSFETYVNADCVWCDTLVDRIVSAESAEPFHFLAIKAPAYFNLERELPLKAAGLNVVYTGDLAPYRMRKVRFLNATHTSMVYWALERGFTEVQQVLADPQGLAFVRQVVFDEIFPTVDLPDVEKRSYAESVLERFANPFAHHQLQSIALNTIAKWRTRCLPVVCDYQAKFGCLPSAMMNGYDAISRHYDAL